MLVTKVEPVTKTKYRVELDQQFAFVLYKGRIGEILHSGNGRNTGRTVREDPALK